MLIPKEKLKDLLARAVFPLMVKKVDDMSSLVKLKNGMVLKVGKRKFVKVN